MDKLSKIFIAGINGMVGSAIKRELTRQKYKHIIGPSSAELDLTNFAKVDAFFRNYKPQYVFLAAAKVGGIWANNAQPADFILSNLKIQNNIIELAHAHKVKKLLFLGSSCIYPKFAKQPITEDQFLAGRLEKTNEPYAVAKIAGIIMCQSYNRQHGTNFISAMPTNLYGTGDTYHETDSHVLPALILKFHAAKIASKRSVKLWGTGTAKREFLFVDDLANACVFLMENYDEGQIVNIGTGTDVTILALAKLIAKTVGYNGKIEFDTSMPDGTPRKLMSSAKIRAYGWKHQTRLEDGIKIAYADYLERIK